MWFFSRKNGKGNSYKRRAGRSTSPVYTMYARQGGRRTEHMHKAGTIALLVAALGGTVWLAIQGGSLVRRWLYTGNAQFVVRNVAVTSSGRLTAEHLKEYGGFGEGQNLFDIDIAMIRKRLQDVPVIRDAQVRRKLPSTLVVHVNERVPMARISQGQAGFFFSIDRDGHVLGLAGPQWRSLPVIKGFSDRGVTPGSVLRDVGAADALALIALCDGSPLGQVIRIASIDVSNPDYLDLALDNGVKVFMPRQVSRNKLEDLAVILREAGTRRTFIDLTLDRNIPAS